MRYCLRDPAFSRFGRTPACDGHTDGQTEGQRAIAFTALAQRRAVKIRLHRIGPFFRLLVGNSCVIRFDLQT